MAWKTTIGQEELRVEADISIVEAALVLAKARNPNVKTVRRVTGKPRQAGWFQAYGDFDKALGKKFRVDQVVNCDRCDGDGKAHGSDRPFESDGKDSYPGPCPVCKGTGSR